ETAGKNLADLVEAEVAVAVCCRLGELAQHHQLGQRRRRADLPGLTVSAESVDQILAEEERQADVAADMLVRAGVFVAGGADEHRACHQLEEAGAAFAAETARADIRDGMAIAALLERLVVRSRIAAKLGDRYRACR